MIDVIVSDNCPHCEDQVSVMEKSFFKEDYRIIRLNSAAFAEYDNKELIDAVPFVVVRETDGAVKYAAKGVHDGTRLWKIIRSEPEAFNLRRLRSAFLAE